ncbi:hypothetical protein BDA99DRAFT_492526 [Phascolomyces articulosus]|uniref:Uncharacterized protein n=1 Tax=Phascolomyces articulosus TaxID=60185 RepID=A0AAD5KC99_9FUNG|nr:hypothetical protein BDA99DRAFT_492526 [Phascolomyces articulosus]
MSTAVATTTTNNKRASKRFSFAGFSLFNKNNNNNNNIPVQQEQKPQEEVKKEKKTDSQPSPPPSQDNDDDERRRRRRAQKSQSLYLQSFRNLTNSKPSRPMSTQYDPAEANQVNHKEVRSSIRRSLSAVLYATPQKQKQQENGNNNSSGSSGLVPVLVTQDLSDRHGGMITSEDIEKKQAQEQKEQEAKKKKKKSIEYDNTLDIMEEKKKDQLVIIWQGYGYIHTVKKKKEEDEKNDDDEKNRQEQEDGSLLENTKEKLENRFEKEIWTDYRGLVHPLHLFQDEVENVEDEEKWGALSVEELRRYFDNYGSMLLKLRDASMLRQQRQYVVMDKKAKEDWILPQALEIPASPTSI